MKSAIVLSTLLVSAVAVAGGLKDYARQWPVGAQDEGAYAVTLDSTVYGQLVRRDLGDLAAFNGSGEALPFGPMPAVYASPPSVWRPVAWFALPATAEPAAGDLSLHITRTAAGDLSLDTTLSHGSTHSVQNILVDVRAPDDDIEGIAFDLAFDAPDFSADVSVEASDDLQNWRTVVPAATVAQLRQGGQALLRRHIEVPPQRATYLRIRALGADQKIPLRALQLQFVAAGPVKQAPARQWLDANFVRAEGRAYVYRMAAPIPAEQLNIVLGDDNSLANFSVSVRDPEDKNWTYVGQLTAFRMRGAGLSLDNEAMDIATSRRPEWRIESNIDLTKTPVLKFAYRPETWLLLTHGSPPFVIAAGSPWAHHGEFPLQAMVDQARAKYGQNWRPLTAQLGPQKDAGGEAALRAYDPAQMKTWLLWGVLALGAVGIIIMVLRLMRAPPPNPTP
jgi:hypothetical protein